MMRASLARNTMKVQRENDAKGNGKRRGQHKFLKRPNPSKNPLKGWKSGASAVSVVVVGKSKVLGRLFSAPFALNWVAAI
jgi:hypothetical protein